jgi:hypothetical protein
MEEISTEQRDSRKPYATPTITRVKLEDRRVVAMGICKDGFDNPACAQDGIVPLYNFGAS